MYGCQAEWTEEVWGKGGGVWNQQHISLKVATKLNLQVRIWHVCCLNDAQLSIFIWIIYGWSRGHKPAGNKFLWQTESIVICHWNAFIARLDLFIMISWGFMGLFFFVLILCCSSPPEPDERCGAFKASAPTDRFNSAIIGLFFFFLNGNCLVRAHLCAYTGIHLREHEWTFQVTLVGAALLTHGTWFELTVQQALSFSLVRWGPIRINQNAEQMDGTAVALRCAPSSPLAFETAIWPYVPIMSGSDINRMNSRLICALFAFDFVFFTVNISSSSLIFIY